MARRKAFWCFICIIDPHSSNLTGNAEGDVEGYRKAGGGGAVKV